MKNFKDVVMAMVGQPFFYEPKGEDVLIRDWKFEKDILSIFTDKGVFTAEFTDIDEFLRKFRNSDTKSLTVQVIQPQLPGAVITGKILEKIRDEALRNIEKVQGDKEYIPQAQQVE